MNIQKLHPIGYMDKTPNGNDYKKSNLWKTVSLAPIVAMDVAALTTKSGRQIKEMSSAEFLRAMTFGKVNISSKAAKIYSFLSIPLEIAIGYYSGHVLDKYVNNNRIKKADAVK